MWPVFAFLLVLGPAAGMFIEVGQRNFSGDDASVLRALRRRMELVRVPPPPHADKLHEASMFALDLEEMREESELGDTRRKNNYRYPNTPLPFDTRVKTVEMMRHHIYATQYRLRDQKVISDKYSNDVSFRMAYTFCRLDTLVEDMLIILSRANKTQNLQDARGNTNENRQSFFVQLVNYTYLLKKNIDVTYIVEFLIEMHTKRVNANTFLPKQKRKARKAVSQMIHQNAGTTALAADAGAATAAPAPAPAAG